MAKILVVDDSATDRRLIGGLVENSGHQVIYAEQGQAAIELIERDCFDLVLTDLVMPVMDGLELVAHLTSEHETVPVVLITGKGSEQIAVKALKAGAANYVPKAILPALLIDTIESVLEAAHERVSELKLMDSLDRCETCFTLQNDPSMIPPLINFMHRTVRSIGCCSQAATIRLCIALEEAITNALFHGNLEISSESRTGETAAYQEIVTARRASPPYRDRTVGVAVNVTPRDVQFIVRDQGPGFDPLDLPDPTDEENLERACGRGLLLMRTFMDSVKFNSAGNEVTMCKCLTSSNQEDSDT